MALYWPEQKVALDIVDDPCAQHVDESLLPGWKVVRTTVAEVDSLEGTRRIGDTLCSLMGVDPPEKTPEWLAGNEKLFNETRLLGRHPRFRY